MKSHTKPKPQNLFRKNSKPYKTSYKTSKHPYKPYQHPSSDFGSFFWNKKKTPPFPKKKPNILLSFSFHKSFSPSWEALASTLLDAFAKAASNGHAGCALQALSAAAPWALVARQGHRWWVDGSKGSKQGTPLVYLVYFPLSVFLVFVFLVLMDFFAPLLKNNMGLLFWGSSMPWAFTKISLPKIWFLMLLEEVIGWMVRSWAMLWECGRELRNVVKLSIFFGGLGRFSGSCFWGIGDLFEVFYGWQSFGGFVFLLSAFRWAIPEFARCFGLCFTRGFDLEYISTGVVRCLLLLRGGSKEKGGGPPFKMMY